LSDRDHEKLKQDGDAEETGRDLRQNAPAVSSAGTTRKAAQTFGEKSAN